jgi:hypothetical protein
MKTLTILKLVVWSILGPLMVLFAIGILYYNSLVAFWIWQNLAVPLGMIPIPMTVWMAATLIHAGCFSTSYQDLFPRDTPQQKKAYLKFFITEMVKPLVVLFFAWLLKVVFL